MNPLNQRIAIAKACGWEQLSSHFGDWQGIWKHPTKGESTTIPDHLSDLNAMHEAEMTLDAEELWMFASKLSCVMDNAPRRFKGMAWDAHQVSPTAAQRAEAFLKTLNLWKDENT